MPRRGQPLYLHGKRLSAARNAASSARSASVRSPWSRAAAMVLRATPASSAARVLVSTLQWSPHDRMEQRVSWRVVPGVNGKRRHLTVGKTMSRVVQHALAAQADRDVLLTLRVAVLLLSDRR